MHYYYRFWVHFVCWFCRTRCNFLSFDAGCDGCHARSKRHLLDQEHQAVLSVGPISHNSIHLLIITTDFVALSQLTGNVAFIYASFLVDLNLETNVCSILKLCPVFWGHVEYKLVFGILNYQRELVHIYWFGKNTVSRIVFSGKTPQPFLSSLPPDSHK